MCVCVCVCVSRSIDGTETLNSVSQSISACVCRSPSHHP